jgi:hypothetical protein
MTDRATQLARDAQEAVRVRALAAHPHVVALRIERVGRQVDALLWAGIALGIGFTTVNVQRFAAAGAPPGSMSWWAAWLLDPMVSLVLLAVIRAEQITTRHQVCPSVGARITKWAAFTATYVMNTWEAWGLDGGRPDAAGIVLHSIPPLLVLLAAEAGPGLRDQLAQAAALAGDGERSDAPVHEPVVHEPVQLDERPVNEGREPDRGLRYSPRFPSSAKGTRTASAGRRLFGDYLAEARAALSAASAQGDAPTATPSWCRTVTGCSAGTSVKLAAALRAEEAAVPSRARTDREPDDGSGEVHRLPNADSGPPRGSGFMGASGCGSPDSAASAAATSVMSART